MPTGLPPRRRATEPSEEEHDDAGTTFVPVLVIVMLLMANIALYFDRYGPPSTYAIATSPADLQLSP